MIDAKATIVENVKARFMYYQSKMNKMEVEQLQKKINSNNSK